MQTYIAFFRGINVGGHNRLPMKALKVQLEKLGLSGIKTYIQSGNVVFQSDPIDPSQLAEKIRAEVKKAHGFDPEVLVLRLDELKTALEANPFPEAEPEPKTLHIGFLASTPVSPDMEGLESLRKDNERFQLKDRYFFLYAPDGIGRSRLAAKAEKLLGVAMTDRNWRTAAKVMALAEEE